MSDRLLQGRPVADGIWTRVQDETARLVESTGRAPRLAIVSGSDASADAYARQIERAFVRRGLDVVVHPSPDGVSHLRDTLARFSADDAIHGVLVLTPLAGGLQLADAIESLSPAKDVDGQHPENLGRLLQRRPAFVPSTALGGLRLLQHYGIPLRGTSTTIVGRSPIVGLPLLLLLLAQHATVTVCHTRTRDLAAETRSADLLCVAAGRAGLIGPEHVRPGAVVVDFGTNEGPDGSLVGDVDFAAVEPIAGEITPVPGGTGPVTVAVLAEQTVRAAQGRHGWEPSE